MTQRYGKIIMITAVFTLALLFSIIIHQQSTLAAPVGGTCTVDDSGGAQYTTIQAALNEVGCSNIQVAAGTYAEALASNRAFTLVGAGSEQTIVQPPSASATVFNISGNNLAVNISGLTLQKGGIGLNASATNITANDLHIQENRTGVYILANKTLTLTNATILENNNSILNEGGGFTNLGTLHITQSKILSNTTTGWGGGIHSIGILQIRQTEIMYNSAQHGGGVSNISQSQLVGEELIIEDSIFAHNQASNGHGGGLFTNNNSKITNVAFFDNEASLVGGGIHHQNNGGGVMSSTYKNVTISGNRANSNGAGFSKASNSNTVTLVHNTIVNNNVTGNETGAGINSSTPAIFINASIIANNNHTASTKNCNMTMQISGGGGKNIEDQTDCGLQSSLFNTDPKLDALANNGGNTYTHALQSDSPARNYVSASCTFIPMDQRDFSRLTDMDDNNTAVCDAGAYEFGAGLNVYLPMIIK